MKKFFLSAIMAVTAFTYTNAQTVVTNDYSTPVTDEKIQKDIEEKSSFSVVSFNFYTFKGINNFGVSYNYISPNSIGLEYAFRSQFKNGGNYSLDIGINWSFQLWKEDKMSLFFTPALGISLRLQKVMEIKSKYHYDSSIRRGYTVQELEEETKIKVDPYFNPRVIFRYDHFAVSAGYYMWAQEAKFKDGYLGHGFQASVGYVF